MSAHVIVQKTSFCDYFLTEDGSYDAKLKYAKRFATAEAARRRLDKLVKEAGWRGATVQVNPLSIREVEA